jgi:hypothetical protein
MSPIIPGSVVAIIHSLRRGFVPALAKAFFAEIEACST